jgi:hypothetical protein
LNDIAPTARFWLDGVLAWLGVPDSQRQECIASGSLVLGGVVVKFLQPPYGDKSYVVARAVVGEIPPPGRCESFLQLVLEVQAMLCGPNTPVLGLDWPDRTLLVSCCLDIPNITNEDAVVILRAIQQMAMEWRQAIAKAMVGTQPAPEAPLMASRC